MSFIDRLNPEVAHALGTYPAERYIAIGDDPPKAREMTEDDQPRDACQSPPD